MQQLVQAVRNINVGGGSPAPAASSSSSDNAEVVKVLDQFKREMRTSQRQAQMDLMAQMETMLQQTQTTARTHQPPAAHVVVPQRQ